MGGREEAAHSTTPTYTVRRDGPAREPSWSAFWLQKPSILRACVREEDAGGREAGAPLDLKMQLENGRADERVSRGQASERAVCVCEAVSVEMGARRPPLPTAVVCPPGRRRRRRLAITADGCSCAPGSCAPGAGASHGGETTYQADGRRKPMHAIGGGHAAMGAAPGGAGRCV
jgi:hypothetical protein